MVPIKGFQHLPLLVSSAVVRQMDLVEILDLCLSFQNIKTATESLHLSISGFKWIITSPGHFAINLIFEDPNQPKIIFKLAQTSSFEFFPGILNGKIVRFARSGNIFTVECGPSVEEKLELFEDLTHELMGILRVEKFYFWSNMFVDFVFFHTKKFETFIMDSPKITTDQMKFMFENLKIDTLKLIYFKVNGDQNPEKASQNSVHIPIANFVRKWLRGESDNFNHLSINSEISNGYLIERSVQEELRNSEQLREYVENS
ncbi:unnamed protein product [Caenorhabditis brenneri]